MYQFYFFHKKEMNFNLVDPTSIIDNSPIETILNLCQVDRRFRNLCHNPMTWKKLLIRDYPHFILREGEDPQTCYRKIYSNHHVNNYIMKAGETFEDLRFYQNFIQFNCCNSGITSLQGCPPSTKLICNFNNLHSLDGCPSSVVDLSCDRNYLDSLEGCPPSVKYLDCSSNLLTSLKGCPPNIILLNCYNNRLTSLHECPISIRYLVCGKNRITTLDNLYFPMLERIEINFNPLKYPWKNMREIVEKLKNGT